MQVLSLVLGFSASEVVPKIQNSQPRGRSFIAKPAFSCATKQG